MSGLRNLQRNFSRHVFGDETTELTANIKANAINPNRRLGVYRNNTYSNLIDALRTTYPITVHLVGDGFFRYLAHAYISRHPSQSGDLHQFGAALADFLATFEPAAGLPYLPDVARLEWAYEQVFYAAESVPFDPQALASIAPESYENLKFVINPAIRLLASKYPVLYIWQVNQANFEGDQRINLSQGGVKLLVLRNHRVEVGIKVLGEGEFTLLQAIAEGCSFAAACERALDVQSDCDIPMYLKQQVLDGIIVDFIL
jgi:hypothetical protein